MANGIVSVQYSTLGVTRVLYLRECCLFILQHKLITEMERYWEILDLTIGEIKTKITLSHARVATEKSLYRVDPLVVPVGAN